MRFVAELAQRPFPVEVSGGEGRFKVKVGEEVWEVDARQPAPGIYSLLIGGASYVADVTVEDGWFLVDVDGETYRIRVEEETRRIIRTRGGGLAETAGQVLAAPLPGKVVHVAVREGQAVGPGDALVVVEAMKMENELKAPKAGTVTEVITREGATVENGAPLVVVE